MGTIPKAPSGQPVTFAKSGFEGAVKISNALYRVAVMITGDDIKFDRLGKIRQIAASMGRAARMTEESEFYAAITTTANLTRNSTTGDASFANAKVSLRFHVGPQERRVSVDWPGFHQGRGLRAELDLHGPPEHESMNIIIPIGRQRFYNNRKINCLPAVGFFQVGDVREEVKPETCLGSLDWGRGVWQYRSFWNWASASGFLPFENGTIGLNLGCGFGDLSKATENCGVVNGRIHKLGTVKFDYRPRDYMHPWRFTDDESRLDLTLTPFKDRRARTNLGILFSEVHQVFGRYNGRVILDDGTPLVIRDLIGFVEEHHARW